MIGLRLRRGAYLVFFEAVLEDVLHHEAPRLAESDLMPHSPQSFVHIFHDLGGRVAPAEFEELLPHMASIAVDDSLGDASKQLVHHDRLVFLWHGVKGLLDDMAAESIHTQAQGVAANGVGDGDHLLRGPMLEATLDKEIAETEDSAEGSRAFKEKRKPVWKLR